MGVPTRFAIEYPQRVSQLLDVLEPEARRRDLLGSFGLLAAMAVLTIPYERMQARHFLHRPDVDSDLSAAYKKLEKEGFKNAALWRGANPGNWREFRIAAETVNQPARWRDVHTGCHPFDPEAKDVIDDHEAEHVIRLLRNALSHGNVIYLDREGREREGEHMEFMAFLTPYDDDGKTFRLLIVGEEAFVRFVRCWTNWIGEMQQDGEIAGSAA